MRAAAAVVEPDGLTTGAEDMVERRVDLRRVSAGSPIDTIRMAVSCEQPILTLPAREPVAARTPNKTIVPESPEHAVVPALASHQVVTLGPTRSRKPGRRARRRLLHAPRGWRS